MIVRTGGGNRELRSSASFDSAYQSWATAGMRYGFISTSGEHITPEAAAGLPAVLNAIRLISETIGALSLWVYSGRLADKKPREDTWQWDLINRRPNPDRSAFDFWSDVAACIETRGDAFAFKAKSRRRVEALFLISPDRMIVRRDLETNELVYWIAANRSLDARSFARGPFSRSEILHIRGLTLDGRDRGITPLQNEAIASSIARYKHEGSIYRNGGSTPYALKFEQSMDRKQAAQALGVWKSTTAGKENTGNPGVLSGGAGIEKLGLTMEDAQFIESHEFGVADVARLFNLSAGLLSGGNARTPTEEESKRFMNFGLRGRLERIAQAVACDPDIFPDAGLYPEHHVDEFLAANALTQAQIRHLKIQDGSLLIDEARAEDGREPLKIPPPDRPGLIPQITPVGGAPNPAAVAANTPTDPETE